MATPPIAASNPDVAYDKSQDQYKVIWRGDQNDGSMVNDQFEIFSQVLGAASLTPVGGNSRVSMMAATDGDTRFGADHTAMAFAPGIGNELVVWQADTDTVAGLVENETEIFGRSVSCEGATPVAPAISIAAVGTTAHLTWSDDPANVNGYELWRSTTPYSINNYLNNVDSGVEEYNDGGALGNVTPNYYYKINGLNLCNLTSADSNLVGEFDFTIVPGS